jgi:nitrogen fixation/metabolism regulation signal transduction histidine kinase
MNPASPLPRSRARRWTWAVALTVLFGVGLVLLFLLAQTTGNRELYERHYARLALINLGVAAALLTVIVWGTVRLWLRLKRGKFGSRLLVKLAAVFALVGVLPGVLVYTVSYQFVSRSIESWFDIKVEGALDAGLNLGRSTLEVLTSELVAKTRNAATQLSDTSDAGAAVALSRLRDQLNAAEVVLWASNGQVIASAGGDGGIRLIPERPNTQMLRNVRNQRAVGSVEGLEDAQTDAGGAQARARVRAMAWVPPAGLGLSADGRYLQITQSLPPGLVSNALAVLEANREYQERALARSGLKRMYIGTLTLVLFLSVFGAVLMAALLGNQMARPLLLLAEGVEQVAAGDLSPKPVLASSDELGGLTRSFADMTRQLSDARSTAERSLSALDAARFNLQTILDNLTAGVIVLDAQGRLLQANPGAARILRAPLAEHLGQALGGFDGLGAFAQDVQARFADFFATDQDLRQGANWQQSYTLAIDASGAPQDGASSLHGTSVSSLSLVVRGAALPGQMRLLVFDDITEVVSAQRAQAWAEVARRVAHEIKNPLTPIQLSAERLARRLDGKLAAPEQAVLDKSVHTIVDQVDALKRIVNDFRDFARLPTAHLVPLDLNALVRDVVALYGSADSAWQADPMGADSATAPLGDAAQDPITVDLAPDCPPIEGDAQLLRQVLHNLLLNAQQASGDRALEPGAVQVRTRFDAAQARVRLSVIDSGPGFAEAILKRAFEPYVTTKPKGTGLGLAVVKKIIDEHAGRIDLNNRQRGGRVVGAQVSISFNVAEAPQTELAS